MRVLLLVLLLHPIQKVCTEVKLPPYHLSNCVQSMVVVLQQSTTIKFSQKDLKEVHINYPDAWQMRQQNDPRIKGVVYNLVRRGIATEVNINELQAGDIVQFWNESWGHCGIAKGANYPKRLLWLYSSMPSTNFSLRSFPFPDEFYACRIKKQFLK
ncbi:hypothetical protein [Runella rosea]|nr:hypothetical protein [Runella rosea]